MRWCPYSIEVLRNTSSPSHGTSADAFQARPVDSPTAADVRSSRTDVEFTPLSPADGASWRAGLEWLGIPCVSPIDAAMAICIHWDDSRFVFPFTSVAPCSFLADTPPSSPLATFVPLHLRWLSDFVPVPPYLPPCEFGSRYCAIRVHLPHGSAIVLFHVPLPLDPGSPLAAADTRARVAAASTLREVKIAVVTVLAACLSHVVDCERPSKASSPSRVGREMSFIAAADVLQPTAACLPRCLCPGVRPSRRTSATSGAAAEGAVGASDGGDVTGSATSVPPSSPLPSPTVCPGGEDWTTSPAVAELKRIVTVGADRCRDSGDPTAMCCLVCGCAVCVCVVRVVRVVRV